MSSARAQSPEEDDAASSDGSGGSSSSGSDRPQGRRKEATMQLFPLQLRFSQKKMRNVFADGKLVDDSWKMVRAIRRTPEEAELYDAAWRLEAPFPPIEVLRWRCKLRDETTGRPLLDPRGREMFEQEESWFTLDNRRLWCLQKAAVQLLPEHCTADVIAEVRKDRRMREIRKFRTLDNGESIMVGSIVDGVPFERWAWRVEAARIAKEKRSGRGGSAGGGGGGGPGRGKGGSPAEGSEGTKGLSAGVKGGKGKGKGGGKGGRAGCKGDGGAHAEGYAEYTNGFAGKGSGYKGKCHEAAGYYGKGGYNKGKGFEGSSTGKGKGRSAKGGGKGGGKAGASKGEAEPLQPVVEAVAEAQ